MIDTAYVLGTIGFFALMLLYARACQRLGAQSDGIEQAVAPEPRG